MNSFLIGMLDAMIATVPGIGVLLDVIIYDFFVIIKFREKAKRIATL